MRLALMSDIHANLHALEAVWADLETQRPDSVYCLGDLVGYGAFPNEVIDFLRQRQIPTVMGNYDDGVGFDREDCGCAYRDRRQAELGDRSLRWTREQTRPSGKAYLRSLPQRMERSDLLMVHGSPRRINEYLYEDRDPETLERIAAAVGPGVLAFGHTHRPYRRQVGETLFVNVGSVGRPLDDDPRAGYVVLTLADGAEVDFRRVSYDVVAASEAIRSAGLPQDFAETLISGRAPAGTPPEPESVRGGAA